MYEPVAVISAAATVMFSFPAVESASFVKVKSVVGMMMLSVAESLTSIWKE